MSQYFDDKNPLFMDPTVTQYGSHMVMTNVNKSIKTKYVNIDTRFRDTYVSSSNPSLANYQMTLPERLTEVKSITVKNIEIPVTFYNISANLGNNAFLIVDNLSLVQTPIVLADGQYSATTLASSINDKLTAAGLTDITYTQQDTFSVFQASLANKYTIQFNVTAQVCSQGSIQIAIDNQLLPFRLGWLLGYRQPSFVISTAGTVGTAFIDLTGPRYLYLVVDEFLNTGPRSFVTPSKMSMINQNVLARITMNDFVVYPYGSIVCATQSNGKLLSDYRTYSGKVNLERMNVQLINECGTVMDLNNGDFAFCLELQHV